MDLFDSKNIPEDHRYLIIRDDLCSTEGNVWVLRRVTTSGDREYFSFVVDNSAKFITREFTEEHLRGEASIGLDDIDTRLQLVAESSISEEDKFFFALNGHYNIEID